MIDTSAQNALKNSIYNAIGFLLPIVILIVYTPIVIQYLGVREYGVYIFLSTILAILGLVDLGIGTATNKHLIEYHSSRQMERLQKLLNSMNSVYLLQAFAYLAVCLCIGITIQTFFITPDTEENYIVLLSIMGGMGFVGSFFSNFINSLVAIQRYDAHLKISGTVLFFHNTSLLVLAILGYGLVPILSAQLVVAVCGALAYYYTTKRVFPILKLKYDWDGDELKKNYRYAIPVAFNRAANSSLVHINKLLIPAFLGNAQLTYYSVPGSAATQISGISNTLSSLLFPITVNLHTLNDMEKIRRVYIRSVRLIALLSSAIALSIIFTADKILLYWLGEDFAVRSTNVLIFLVVANFTLALFSPLSQLLTAMSKLKFLTLGSIIMTILNLAAFLLLLPIYGIVGAAAAYSLSTLFVVWMFYYAERHYFEMSGSTHLKALRNIALTAIPFYMLVSFVLYPAITSIYTLAIIGPGCVVLFLALYKLLGFAEPEDWVDFKMLLSKILKAIRI